MLLTLCKSKLHRATVTQAELHYEGSLTLDAALMDGAGIVPFERVQVLDLNNGARFDTYAIEAPAESGTVCVNGAAARLVHPGDQIIVVTYAQLTPEEARRHRPVILLLNPDNTVRERITADPAADARLLAEWD